MFRHTKKTKVRNLTIPCSRFSFFGGCCQDNFWPCAPTSPLLIHTNGCSGWFTIVIIFMDDLCCSFLGDSRKEVLDWINMGRPHYLTPAFLHAGWLISYGSPCSSHTWLLVVRGIVSCVLWRCLQDGATHRQSVIVFYMSKKEKARRHLKNCKAHAERWYSLKQKNLHTSEEQPLMIFAM